MPTDSPSTRWSLIAGAARGEPLEREAFILRYGECIRAALRARTRGPLDPQVAEDAEQEVWLQLFKDGGALERLERDRGGFRAYLFGLIRNVSRELMRREARRGPELSEIPLSSVTHEEDEVRRAFDRAWAQSLCSQARQILRDRAHGEEARLRLDLMEMRYGAGLVPRTISARTGLDAPRVHRLLTRGRKEFRSALLAVLADHFPAAGRADLEDQMREILGEL